MTRKADLVKQNTDLNNRLEFSRKAARIALKALEGMTSDQFSRGLDRRIRRLLGAIEAKGY